MDTELFILITDIIGTVAFAVSGAMAGIRKKMDIFGVNILALLTATGGGIIRDIVMGEIPPTAFKNPFFVIIAAVAANITFIQASLIILQKLAIVMLLPLLLGWFVQHYVKPLCQWIKRHPDLGFYSWGCSLAITTGVTVKNICNANTSVSILLMIALLSACVCVLHFIIGRRIGKSFNERINCGQGMFQKNTGMAIWVAYMYLNPVASIGAGCYVLWQNIINSYEIWEQREQS